MKTSTPESSERAIEPCSIEGMIASQRRPHDAGAWEGNAHGLTALLEENQRLKELAERQMNDAEAARLELAEAKATIKRQLRYAEAVAQAVDAAPSSTRLKDAPLEELEAANALPYDKTYGARAERALLMIADGNSAALCLATEGFKSDAEWAEAIITQHRVDVNFAKAQRDVAEEKLARVSARAPRFPDQNRFEWVCERLSEHSMYIKRYEHAHELPRGGFAIHSNSTMLGYGETISDAIDAAMARSDGGSDK